MKAISQLLVSSLLIISAVPCMAADKVAATTLLDKNWKCTTNASSASLAVDKAADENMSTKFKSAANAFGFASRHCRDCTEITCKFTKAK